MKKVLVKSLLVIIETGIEEIADRLKKRRRQNDRYDELAHVHGGCGAYDLRDRSAGHDSTVGCRRTVRKKRVRRRSISKEKQKT
jgi:hypothetical protein